MDYLLLSILIVLGGRFSTIYVAESLCPSGFSGPSCHKENIALNRSTAQSSIYGVYASKLAVDGNTNKSLLNGSCTHTNNDSRSSWSVLLDHQKGHNITNVTLYLRNKHACRYKDLQVTVDSVLCGRGNITNTNDTSESAAPTPNPVLLGCHQPLRGHNVTVHVNNSYLTLCEVQIWVCEDGWFGDDCSEGCRCKNTSEVCDKLTGYCRSGCSSGWEGRDCQIACSNNTYGTGCLNDCGHCLNSSSCDPVNGSCSSGCDPGWRTHKCDQEEIELTKPDTDAYVPAVVTVGGVVILLIVTVVIVLIKRRWRKCRKDNSPMSTLNAMQQPEVETRDGFENASHDIYENYKCLPPDIKVADLQEYIKQKISQGDFEVEFKCLRYGIAGNHEAGKKPENKPRNRFVGLFPYDSTRVVLIPDGAWTWDYINESFVPGCEGKPIYIAAQGPNPETINDFWRMVWQQNVCKIVMLTRLMEMNKKECPQYWPDEDEVKQFGNITVQITRKTVRADYTIRTFNIKHTDSPVRKVTHYHFTSWPDDDVPDTSVLVSFWRHVKHADTQTDTGPLVIHCSAGVGQTGTFIGLDILYTEAEAEGKINIFKCIAKMREARMNMVQTVDQYQFLHEALLEALKSRGTFYSLVEFEQKYGLRESFDQSQKEDLLKEFQSLQSLRSEFEEEQLSNSLLSETINKNRSLEILPANANRPFLSPVAGRNDYINPVMLPSVTRPRYYIVSQTPLPDTAIDFWSLVYDHDCFIIVCLEDSQDLSSLVPDETMSTTVGPFEIQNLMVDRNRDAFTVTKLEIQYNQQIECSREVQVYKFFGLADGETSTEAILQFIEALQNRHAEEEQHMLVMCNDGCRYSGVFCSLMNIISKLQRDKQVDNFLTIRQLQSIRPQFVQTFDQYKFCYSMVKKYCYSLDKPDRNQQ